MTVVQGENLKFPMYRLIKSNWNKAYDELENFAVVLVVRKPEDNEKANLVWVVKALKHNCTMEDIEEAYAQTLIHFGVDVAYGINELEPYLKSHGAVPMG